MRNELRLHHTALSRGYVKVAEDGMEETYNGRFGEGIKIYRHNTQSTQYCIVEYWVK